MRRKYTLNFISAIDQIQRAFIRLAEPVGNDEVGCKTTQKKAKISIQTRKAKKKNKK